MEALVSNIQRYSVHDGPGIRTTVFFKGCSMRCLWCHNPECIDLRPVLQYFPDKCIGCGICVAYCPAKALIPSERGMAYKAASCRRCFRCVSQCPASALVKNGEKYSVEELVAEILKDRPFYETSGGGVTFSGGEALLQIPFLSETLKRCKAEGLHCTIDTAGYVPWDNFKSVLGLADLFLYDVKAMDPEKHRKFVGTDNGLVLENLRKLSLTDTEIIIRIPVIPTFNDTVRNMEDTAIMLDSLGRKFTVELLGYHDYAGGKYRGIWKEPVEFPKIGAAELESLGRVFTERGHLIKVHSHS